MNNSGESFEIPANKQGIYSAKVIFKGSKDSDGNSVAGCFENNIFIDTRPESFHCSSEYGRTIVQIQDTNFYDNMSSVFFGETARLNDQKIYESENLQTQFLSYVSPPLYQTSSICSNSKVKTLERITSSEIIESSVVGDSLILNSKIANTKLIQHFKWSPGFTNVVSSNATIAGDVNINNSNLSEVDIKSLSVDPSSIVER